MPYFYGQIMLQLGRGLSETVLLIHSELATTSLKVMLEQKIYKINSQSKMFG